MARRALVIGAGFGGLAVAVRLAAQGWSVTVLERNGQPGGRARVEHVDGYTFDLGPSVLTGPSLLKNLWKSAGRELSDYVELLRVDPSYRFVFTEGGSLELSQRAEFMRAEVARFAPQDAAGWEAYRLHVERFWDLTVRQVMHARMETPWDLLRFAPGMLAGSGFLSMDALVRRYLTDERLMRAMRFHPTFVGASPWAPGSAIYSAIQGLEWEEGVWFPKGGTHALVRAMEKLGRDLGVTYRYNADVVSLVVEGGRARGVLLTDGERLDADAVVSNADAAWTYSVLVPQHDRGCFTDRYFDDARYTTGLFVWYFGTRRAWPDVAHHTVILDRAVPTRWNPAGAESFEPFTYLHRPTASDPSLAPDGCDSFYALRAVPNLQGIKSWAVEAEAQRRILRRTLANTVLPGLDEAVLVERQMDPHDFRRVLRTVHGAAFGLAPTLLQSAIFRPHPASGVVPGLYLVGEGTHPGPGVPAVISSARIVADLLG